MPESDDRTGTPPTAADIRASAADIPDALPITAGIVEQVAQLAEDKLREGPALARQFTILFNAIAELEKRIARLEG